MKRDLREMESVGGATCLEDSLLAWDRLVFECLQCKPSPTAVPKHWPSLLRRWLGLCTGHSRWSPEQQLALNLHSISVTSGCEADKGLLVITWHGKNRRVAGEEAMRK